MFSCNIYEAPKTIIMNTILMIQCYLFLTLWLDMNVSVSSEPKVYIRELLQYNAIQTCISVSYVIHRCFDIWFIDCFGFIYFFALYEFMYSCWNSQNNFSNFDKRILAEWRSGSVWALPCERPGFGPRKSRPATAHARAEKLGQLGLPGCDEALSGMGGASLTSEVPGVSTRRFSSKVGYVTLPRFPRCEQSHK